MVLTESGEKVLETTLMTGMLSPSILSSLCHSVSKSRYFSVLMIFQIIFVALLFPHISSKGYSGTGVRSAAFGDLLEMDEG